MNKNIGFRRNIYLEWLDATATLRLGTDDVREIRAQLDPIVARHVASIDNRRIAIDILVNIWVKSGATHPALHETARDLFRSTAQADDRLWLHYGMTMLAYDFFRSCVGVIGELSRTQDALKPADVKRAMVAERGALGALDMAVTRVIFSLRNWGILVDTETRHAYAPLRRHFAASTKALEAWMLAVALRTHAGEELAFIDLMRRPALFPFRFQMTVDELRQSPWFAVQRQGAGIDMVRLAGASVV